MQNQKNPMVVKGNGIMEMVTMIGKAAPMIGNREEVAMMAVSPYSCPSSAISVAGSGDEAQEVAIIVGK